MLIVVLFVLMLTLLILESPVGVALGLSSIIVMLFEGGLPLQVVIQKMFNQVNSFSLISLPFFMMAGAFMQHGGLTRKIVDFADSLVGWMTGGMCYVSVGAGIVLGGISGSCSADTAALSAIMIPAMTESGYKKNFAAALQAASGCLGLIIPPSVPMIIIGGITGISVARMFVGGILPGLVVALMLMIAARIMCGMQHMGSPDGKKFRLSRVWITFKAAFLSLMAPVIIIGGILGGIFTATEASVVAAVYTFILSAFIYREMSIKQLLGAVFEAGRKTGEVMFIVAAASVFSYLLTVNNVHVIVRDFVYSISSNPAVIVFIMMFIFFVLAMFIDETPLIIMLLPIFLPIAESVGMDPMVFCIMMVVNNAIGGIMPPVGTAVFVASAAGEISATETSKQIGPFVVVYMVATVLIYMFPQLVTFLPSIVF